MSGAHVSASAEAGGEKRIEQHFTSSDGWRRGGGGCLADIGDSVIQAEGSGGSFTILTDAVCVPSLPQSQQGASLVKITCGNLTTFEVGGTFEDDLWNGMCYESWNFSTHFSTPEMLGFRCTFFCTETTDFRPGLCATPKLAFKVEHPAMLNLVIVGVMVGALDRVLAQASNQDRSAFHWRSDGDIYTELMRTSLDWVGLTKAEERKVEESFSQLTSCMHGVAAAEGSHYLWDWVQFSINTFLLRKVWDKE
ncbi:hypothetical protein B0H13DRAFT_1884326 [Mycena leptocephala]|nr:hypothetical protein B0H13DRAFT_1884326 [Mycena leptocephala]